MKRVIKGNERKEEIGKKRMKNKRIRKEKEEKEEQK